MKFSTISYSLLACLSPLVSATALTYKLSANEKACFFSFVENKGAKVAFYFAVSPAFPPPPSFFIFGTLNLELVNLDGTLGLGMEWIALDSLRLGAILMEENRSKQEDPSTSTTKSSDHKTRL